MKTIIKISIFGAVILVSLIFLGYQGMKEDQWAEASNEYEILQNEETQIRMALISIEQDHTYYGLVYYSEFSHDELKIYLDLLNGMQNTNQEVQDWIIRNELIMKDWGKTDLFISEYISELKKAEDIYDKRIKAVVNLLKTQDLMTNWRI